MSTPAPPQQKGIFTIPRLIKTLFDTFPLITYPAYPAPARSPKPTTRARLYVWTAPDQARKPGGGYSFDPECLKWQVGGSTSPFTLPFNCLRDGFFFPSFFVCCLQPGWLEPLGEEKRC